MKQQPNKSLEQQIVDALSGGECTGQRHAGEPDHANEYRDQKRRDDAAHRARTGSPPIRWSTSRSSATRSTIANFACSASSAAAAAGAAPAEVEAAEEHVKWLEQYEALKSKIAAAAERWLETYADCIADLANLIRENESFADEISRINLAAPSGEPRRLRLPN